MISAYVLVKTDPGTDEAVRKKILSFDGVVSAERSYGSFDIILKAELESGEELDDFVFEKLRKTPGVRDTVTVITTKSER